MILQNIGQTSASIILIWPSAKRRSTPLCSLARMPVKTTVSNG